MACRNGRRRLRDEQGRSYRGMARAGGSCGAGRGGRVEGAGGNGASADRIYTTGARRKVAGRGGESGRVGCLHGSADRAAQPRGDGEGTERGISERGGPERFLGCQENSLRRPEDGRESLADL